MRVAWRVMCEWGRRFQSWLVFFFRRQQQQKIAAVTVARLCLDNADYCLSCKEKILIGRQRNSRPLIWIGLMRILGLRFCTFPWIHHCSWSGPAVLTVNRTRPQGNLTRLLPYAKSKHSLHLFSHNPREVYHSGAEKQTRLNTRVGHSIGRGISSEAIAFKRKKWTFWVKFSVANSLVFYLCQRKTNLCGSRKKTLINSSKDSSVRNVCCANKTPFALFLRWWEGTNTFVSQAQKELSTKNVSCKGIVTPGGTTQKLASSFFRTLECLKTWQLMSNQKEVPWCVHYTQPWTCFSKTDYSSLLLFMGQLSARQPDFLCTSLYDTDTKKQHQFWFWETHILWAWSKTGNHGLHPWYSIFWHLMQSWLMKSWKTILVCCLVYPNKGASAFWRTFLRF